MGNKSFVFRFADIEVREREFSLIKDGEAQPVEPKAFRVLLFLLRNPQKLIKKEELLNAVWGDATVTENSLTRSIALLRRLLGDDIRNPRFIETVATVGYRFVCNVEVSEDASRNLEAPETPDGQSGGESVQSTALEGAAAPHVQVENRACDKTKTVTDRKEGSRSFLRWLQPIAAVLAIGLATAVWFLHRPLPPPSISKFTMITHDGRKKFLGGTDGSRVYFTQASPDSISQVGITGGEIAQIPIALPRFDYLVNVSPDGSNLLIAAPQEGHPGLAMWNVRTLGGSFRRLADAALDGAFSPDGNSVAYSTPEGDIYLVQSDGRGAHKLASPGDSPHDLSWSPDGETIRFTAHDVLWEMSSNGSNLHTLLPDLRTSPIQGGTWTANGKFFVFASGGQLWAIDERRGLLRRPRPDPIQLTSSPVHWELPVAGKDGTQIFADGEIPRGELSRLDPHTGQSRPFLGGISADSVSFSKDGRFVAYVTFPEGILWKSNSDGSSPMQLSDHSIHARHPRWSPDGTQIVYEGDSSPSHSELYIVSATTGSSRRLLPENNGEQGDPNWSDDGRKVVFAAQEARDPGKEELRILDLDSGQITPLPGSVGMSQPGWSPDGRYIAALSWDAQSLKIFDIQTQRWATLPTNGDVEFPNWSKDSRSIYYLRMGPDQAVFRIRVTGEAAERVVDLKDWHLSIDLWLGLDPTDAPLLLRDIGSGDIYALTLDEK